MGIIRKYAGWDLSRILDEYKAFAEPKIRDCDIEYITAFDNMQLDNLWARESTFEYRIRRFCKATTFTMVVLVIWLYSGSVMATAGTAITPRPQPTA